MEELLKVLTRKQDLLDIGDGIKPEIDHKYFIHFNPVRLPHVNLEVFERVDRSLSIEDKGLKRYNCFYLTGNVELFTKLINQKINNVK